MKKRNRLIIVLLVVVLCGIFLYPTYRSESMHVAKLPATRVRCWIS